MEKVREVWYDAYKGFPIGGSCPQSGLMRAAFRRSLFMGCPADLPLIRPSATFPQGGRHHNETRSPP